MGNYTDKLRMTHRCRLALLCILGFLLGLLILFYTNHPPVSAQAPTSTCSQPDDVDIAFAFCDAAHDDIADVYAPPLRDVSTDGYIPSIILKAVGAYESTWTQCNADGTPFGPTGCDWGIMQIWSGMNCDAPENQFNSQTRERFGRVDG